MDEVRNHNNHSPAVETQPSFSFSSAQPDVLLPEDLGANFLAPESGSLVAEVFASKSVEVAQTVQESPLLFDTQLPDNTFLDDHISTARTTGGSHASVQLPAIVADITLWHTPDNEAWVTLPVADHHEHWSLKSQATQRWIARRYYEQIQAVPTARELHALLGLLEGHALFDGAKHTVFTRLAEHNGTIYLDLCNERWEAVEITTTGWEVVSTPPVKFRRSNGMLPLPYPERGGSMNELRPFVNVPPDMNGTPAVDWVLLVAWLLASLRPRGPYPVLELNGEQGSAKSTLARVLRSLVDPSSALLRTMPRNERDLMISAEAEWIMAYDNLSCLPQWLSDAFCRLATGGGFATRKLFSDNRQILFDAQRPILLTGIEDVAINGDLLDRTLPLVLPAIPDDRRQSESAFWEAFEATRPRILGALLEVVARTLRKPLRISAQELLRMADFAEWVIAAESELGWKAGTFMAAYSARRAQTNEVALDGSPVAGAVQALVGRGAWEGTASDLLTTIGTLVSDRDTRLKTWPKSPLALSNALRRLTPNLRLTGVLVSFSRTGGSNSKRLITIEKR